MWIADPGRSDVFDDAILSSNRRNWHPLSMAPDSFAEPYDISTKPLLPENMIVGLQTRYVSERLNTPALRTRFINESVRIYMSDILYGERAAFSHAAQLCLTAQDLGAQEHAANQAREEARHVTAFTFYIRQRWGEPSPATPVFGQFLKEVASSKCIRKEIAGIQVLLEGLAMGIFTALQGHLSDPLGQEIIRGAMADEASHVKMGAAWMERALDTASVEQRGEVALWTARQFQRLSRGLFAPTQRPELYASFGLDSSRVARELRDYDDEPEHRSAPTTIFQTAARAIVRAGLVSPRTGKLYASFLGVKER